MSSHVGGDTDLFGVSMAWTRGYVATIKAAHGLVRAENGVHMWERGHSRTDLPQCRNPFKGEAGYLLYLCIWGGVRGVSCHS